jgi:hypothetical protein
MKQKIYIFGLINAMIIVSGTFFKVNHFPGAGVILTIGFATLVLLFLPVALTNHYNSENKQNLVLHIVTWLTCLVVFTAMLFKIQHWPYSGFLLIFALPFPYVVFLPVFLSVTSKNKNFSIYNTVIVLILLSAVSVFSLLFALNVTRERINDSFDLARNYNKLELALNEIAGTAGNISVQNKPSSINLKIDELLKVVDEYQYLILSEQNITEEQWTYEPGIISRPDSKQAAADALLKSNEPVLGEKLETGLKSLIREFEKTPGYEDFAEAAPVILNYKESETDEVPWAYSIFADNNQAWALIYLDGLEVNLKMIKALAITNN